MSATITTVDKKKVFVLVSPKNRTAYNFRGELIADIIAKGYEVYVTGPNRIDVDKIEALGATFVEIPNDKNGVSVRADVTYFLRLLSLFRRLRPDATLGYTVKPAIYGAMAARLVGVRSVTSMITGVGYLFISKSRKAKMLKALVLRLYRMGLACANHVIFQNPDDCAEFIEHGLVSESKTYLVNGSGVNMSRFEQRPYPKQLTFFMLSRIMYSKGVMEYAQAARMLKARYPHVRFMLLGAFEGIQDSLDEAEFKRDFIEPGIIDYFRESNHIADYFAQASVYVLPSYREGTPRTVLEAMAMGRAIVTTDAPGCRETVIADQNGFLVPVKDVNALAAAMASFVEDPTLVTTMGKASAELCRNKYRVELVNETMTSIMEL